MAKTKISLLPCAPGNLDEMNKWINEEAEQGWQITGSVFRLPFLARFRQGEGGPYQLFCGFIPVPDENLRVCFA